MLIYYEGQPYWVIEGTTEEHAAIANIPKAKRSYERTRNLTYMMPAVVSLVGLIAAGIYFGHMNAPVVLVVGLMAPFILGVIATLLLIAFYEYRRPFLRLQQEGRVVDVQSGEGKLFLDILFSGKCELNEANNRYAALELISPALIDAFWLEKSNRELLHRLSRHSSGEAGVLARQLLVAAMEDIMDDAERHVAWLRKLELLAQENASARAEKEELDAYIDLRKYLQGVGLLPQE